MAISAFHITITGVVQGVGFRPFVYNLAQRLGLHGWVLNHSGGVDIEAEGEPELLEAFVVALRAEAPPLAHITSLEATAVSPNGHTRFEIRHSESQAGRFMLISPDVATCSDCLRELFDPRDRRYRYPFINCTNCGPRFTIIKDIPYDRPLTTMREFPLCDACRAEYENPADRRFHAQPNACPVCGPRISKLQSQPIDESGNRLDNGNAKPVAAAAPQQNASSGGDLPSSDEVLAWARDLLLDGGILAIKGLGGFQLACDATNADAVQRLRERKRRPHKPFAVMVASLEEARRHCEVSPEEMELLTSPQAPIVLLNRLPFTFHVSGVTSHASHIVNAIAPHQHTLGLMLPYTPLHHLLLRDVGRPLVMTSGNLSEEPIAKDNEEAIERLSGIADGFLLHDRGIYARYDDSVVRVRRAANSEACNATPHTPRVEVLRRSRGYAPFPITLPFEVGQVFAAGPLLKNTFTVTRDQYAFVSQHIGDLEDLETLGHYETALATYLRLFRIEPERVVCDLHPDYLSTRLAIDFARERGLPAPVRVQHHRAHIAACLADNGWTLESGPVIGVALDGTGYGDDATIWGGEWFVGDYYAMRRAAHLQPLPLPGGDVATRQPWRIAVAYLNALIEPEDYPAEVCFAGFCPSEAGLIRQQIERGLNVPLTTSMGRLFDAVSALLGVRSEITYEGQAAIELEQLAELTVNPRPYPFDFEDGVVWLAPLFHALLDELARGTPASRIASRFHATIAQMVADVCVRLRDETGITTVALSGGVFQNAMLLDLTLPLLRESGFAALLHHQVPCNDGGISLGQCVMGRG